MNRRLILFAAVLLAAGYAGRALAQSSPGFKQCGQTDSKGNPAPNANCPACVGNCRFLVGQMYNVCEQAGTGCKNNKTPAPFCSGSLMTGDPFNTANCFGSAIGTCQQTQTGC